MKYQVGKTTMTYLISIYLLGGGAYGRAALRLLYYSILFTLVRV